jgi:hypothetical protein
MVVAAGLLLCGCGDSSDSAVARDTDSGQRPARPVAAPPKQPAGPVELPVADAALFARQLDDDGMVRSVARSIATLSGPTAAVIPQFKSQDAQVKVVLSGPRVEFRDASDPKGALLASMEAVGRELQFQWAPVSAAERQGALSALDSMLPGMTVQVNGTQGAAWVLRVSEPAKPAPAPAPAAAPAVVEPDIMVESTQLRPRSDTLGDIVSTECKMCRFSSPITSLKASVDPSVEGFDLTQKSEKVIELSKKSSSGKKTLLASIEAKPFEVVWKWNRVATKEFGDAVGAIQQSMSSMLVTAQTRKGAPSVIGIACPADADGPDADGPDADDDGDGDMPPVQAPAPGNDSALGRAIRAAETAYRDEANIYSRQKAAERKKSYEASERAQNAARQGRNRQQRYEEKNGWTDSEGRWHAPDGHMSRSKDDRLDGRAKARPGRTGGPGALKGDWGVKMAQEVAQERQRNPAAGKPETLLVPSGDPLDCKQVADFIDDYRSLPIADARIRAMLDIIRREMDKPGSRSK